MFRSPRYLVHRHVQRALRKSQQLTDNEDESLEAGQEHLRSFFIPGMTGGLHTITVTQQVKSSDEEIPLVTTQQFEVQAPQFVLPDNAIHTSYPPQGATARADTIPHVIFNDPTLPWERVGSWNSESTPPPDYSRNRTPWVALLVFTEQELKLAAEDLGGPTSLFQDVPSLKAGAKQDAAFNIKLLITELVKVRECATPYKPDSQDQTVANCILVKADLFRALFTQYAADGSPVQTTSPYVYHHRLLAHKRVINTQGMAVTGSETTDDTGSFGVVVSQRSAPSSITVPTPMFVHLVSIEQVEQLQPWPTLATTRFVSLVSLASWSYICLPPSTPSMEDVFEHLGSTLTTLQPSLSKDARKTLSQSLPTGPRVLDRLDQGYSMLRYRVQSGETTTGLYRGPFVPVETFQAPEHLPKTSMTGFDLSVLDRSLGIMDITFSAAWQLGRAMAIADQAFTSALYRVRTQIIQRATTATEYKYTSQFTWRKRKQDLLRQLNNTVESLDAITRPGKLLLGASHDRRRWEKPSIDPLDLSYHGAVMEAMVDVDYTKAAKEIASTPDPQHLDNPSDKPYDEYNAPFSADWVVVLRWVLDRLFLASIPAHYLLSDASHLPVESIRFFHVEDNWVNCMLDGALSLGNHIDQEADKVRDAIKNAITWYLSSPTSVHTYFPPVPKFGCFIRSGVIAQFPDLIVQVQPAPASDAGTDVAPVLLRHEVIDKGTMLCLFSVEPNETTFQALTLTQPPQQQTFRIGQFEFDPATGTTVGVTMPYYRAYTVANPSDPNHRSDIDRYVLTRGKPPPENRPVNYLWTDQDYPPAGGNSKLPTELNLLLIENLAKDYNNVLLTKMPQGLYSDNTPTSALMAWMLNERSLLLPISAKTGATMPDDGPRMPPPPRMLPVHHRKLPALPDPPVNQKLPPHRPAPDYQHDDGGDGQTKRTNYRPKTGPNPNGRYARPRSSPKRHTESRAVLSASHSTALSTTTDASIPEQATVTELVKASLFPQFGFYFWSLEQPGTPGTPDSQGTIPMLTDAHGQSLAQSIIFSINIVNNASEAWRLTKIEIIIPMGPPRSAQSAEGIRAVQQESLKPSSTTVSDRVQSGRHGDNGDDDDDLVGPDLSDPLTQLYDGPGASMLSNLRFNPFTSFSENYQELHVQLLPRSHLGYVTADRCVDMSFLLSGVKVNLANRNLVVSPTINIYYTGSMPIQHPTQYPQPFMTLSPVKK